MLDRPTAAPHIWPYPRHRNMAEVIRQERHAEIAREIFARRDDRHFAAPQVNFASERTSRFIIEVGG